MNVAYTSKATTPYNVDPINRKETIFYTPVPNTTNPNLLLKSSFTIVSYSV